MSFIVRPSYPVVMAELPMVDFCCMFPGAVTAVFRGLQVTGANEPLTCLQVTGDNEPLTCLLLPAAFTRTRVVFSCYSGTPSPRDTVSGVSRHRPLKV